MATPTRLDSRTSPVLVSSRPRIAARDVRDLTSFAVRGLAAMFDQDRNLFCHRLLCTERGLVREGVSHRYTIMTLLGLKELESAGMHSPFDVQAIYTSLIGDTNWIRGVGDLGLLIWLTAKFEPYQLEDVFRTFDCDTVLDRCSDAQESRTMELAWFLAGLTHAAETSPKLLNSLTDVSVETYHRVEENQGDSGLFGHMNIQKSLTGRVRGRIGSFADQVYAIYAMSKFARTFCVEDPLGPALKCTTAICGAQGELGQWWWLYDVGSGQVSSRYPVYSVHQHGMGPMALFAVEEATGQHFSEFVYKGLRWIYGGNELGVDMRDGAQNLIWRCVLPRNKQAKYWEMVLSAVGQPGEGMRIHGLKVLAEQRPYEFGWLLFAFSKHAQRDRLSVDEPENA